MLQAASPTDQLRTSSRSSQGKPLVVLLHGLARGRRALERLRRLFLVWLFVADRACDYVRSPLSHGRQKKTYKDTCGFRRIQEDTGLTAVSLQYPSTRQPINKLAAGVAEEVKDLVLQGGHEGVWAVTHSLGGIVQRHIMGLPDQGTACVLSPLVNVQLYIAG